VTLAVASDDDESEDVQAEDAQEESETEDAAAEEEQEDGDTAAKEQGVTLQVDEDAVSDEDAEEESEEESEEQSEEETQKQTYAEIDSVQTDAGAIVATDVSGVVENFLPAMVSITCTAVQDVTTLYGTEEYEEEVAASGVIIAQNEEELLIATNSQAVEDQTDLQIWFAADEDQAEGISGKVKGTDKNYELAVVAVQLSDIPQELLSELRVATLGHSDGLKVGQTAIAIGSELTSGQRVSCGVISALNCEVSLNSQSVSLFLMDTPIHFGSSGGVVLNAQGEVIGISVEQESSNSTESVSYAIPIDTAIPVLESLANRQTRDKLSDSERGYIGATVVNVSDDAKDLYDMPEGAFVYDVAEGSAAEAAGIRKGDIITKFDGDSVYGSTDLIDKISHYAVGETVTMEIQTANNGTYESREVEVTLQAGTGVSDATEDAEEETDLEAYGEEDDTIQLPFGFGGQTY
jgi:serine protease Do